MADEKLSLSLDDIISKNKKPERPARANAPKGPRRGAAKPDGDGPAGGTKARALGIAVGKATKRQGAAPRRNSGGAPRRQVEVVELREVIDASCALSMTAQQLATRSRSRYLTPLSLLITERSYQLSEMQGFCL